MKPAEVEAAIADVQRFLEYLLPGSLRDPRERVKDHVKRVVLNPDIHDDLDRKRAADYVDLLSEAKKRRGGQAKGVRNYLIVRALLRVERKLGLDMTRNPATQRDSCCSIVAAACRCLDVHLAERGVEEIWRNSDEYKRRRV